MRRFHGVAVLVALVVLLSLLVASAAMAGQGRRGLPLPYRAILAIDGGGMLRTGHKGRTEWIFPSSGYPQEICASADGRQIAARVMKDDFGHIEHTEVWEADRWETWSEIGLPPSGFIDPDTIYGADGNVVFTLSRPGPGELNEPETLYDGEYSIYDVDRAESGILFVAESRIVGTSHTEYRLALVDPSAESGSEVLYYPTGWNLYLYLDLDITPDGSKILWREWEWPCPEPCRSEVFWAYTGEEEELLVANAWAPAWLPDGGYAYSQDNELWMFSSRRNRPAHVPIEEGWIDSIYPYPF